MVDQDIALTFGIVLAAAVMAGLVADLLRLPKVTGYLLVGMVLGHHSLDWLVSEHVVALEPFRKLAIGLVLFSLGCHFPMSHARRVLRRVIRISGGELLATFVLVTVGLVLLVDHWAVALILGALALATAPATTILVLKETESEGPLTEYSEAMVILNNFACILAFELVYLLIQFGTGLSSDAWYVGVRVLLRDILGAIGLGIGMGLVVSFACGLVSSSRWLVLLVAGTCLLLGLDEQWNIPYMLSFLAMGLTVANASEHSKDIVTGLDRLTGFLCVVFFVLSGAHLHMEEFLSTKLIFGAGGAYIVLRLTGKFLGTYVTARWAKEPPAVRNWLGTSLMAQAGAAVALASLAVERDKSLGTTWGAEVQTVILGTVVFFEIVGPLLTRLSVLRAGEVPLDRVVHHSSSTPMQELQGLWTRLMISFGYNPAAKQGPESVKIADMMRKSVEGLNQSDSLEEIITLIHRSHDNTYAVVDSDSALVGVMRYSDLSHVVLDMEAATLVRATDLASPVVWKLYVDDPVERAQQLFRKTRDDCIPVITRDDSLTYVGMVRRRDMMRYIIG